MSVQKIHIPIAIKQKVAMLGKLTNTSIASDIVYLATLGTMSPDQLQMEEKELDRRIAIAAKKHEVD